jgi:hypothetical protein
MRAITPPRQPAPGCQTPAAWVTRQRPSEPPTRRQGVVFRWRAGDLKALTNGLGKPPIGVFGCPDHQSVGRCALNLTLHFCNRSSKDGKRALSQHFPRRFPYISATFLVRLPGARKVGLHLSGAAGQRRCLVMGRIHGTIDADRLQTISSNDFTWFVCMSVSFYCPQLGRNP